MRMERVTGALRAELADNTILNREKT